MTVMDLIRVLVAEVSKGNGDKPVYARIPDNIEYDADFEIEGVALPDETGKVVLVGGE